MKRLYLRGLIALFLFLFALPVKAQEEAKVMQHKIVFQFPVQANMKAALLIIKVDVGNPKILVDWGDGNGVVEETLKYGSLEHDYTSEATADRIVIIDGSDIERISASYKGTPPSGIKSIDAPQLKELIFNMKGLADIPVLDLSGANVPMLKKVELTGIEEFVAPASLETFNYSSSFGSDKLLRKLDVTRASHLKSIIASTKYNCHHDLKELDLTNNQEVETLEIGGSSFNSQNKTNHLAIIKGIKELKNLKKCHLSYQALDFNNLPTSQDIEGSDIQYKGQKFIIPENKITIAKVDMSYLRTVNNGFVNGEHATTFTWYYAPSSPYSVPKKIDPSKYDDDNGVFTFHTDLFEGNQLSGDIVCQVSNAAYPDYGDGYSQPIHLSLGDTDHLFTIDIVDNVYTKYAGVEFQIFKQKKVNKKWVNDGEVKSGDKIDPDTHLSISATWQGDLIIKNWIINGQVFEKTNKENKKYVVTYNPLYYNMPKTGALDIKFELQPANLTWGMILPEELTDEEKGSFKIHAFVKEDGQKDLLHGQKMKDEAYGAYLIGLKHKTCIFEAILPEGYEVKKWTINKEEIEADGNVLEANFAELNINKINYQIKAEIQKKSENPHKMAVTYSVEDEGGHLSGFLADENYQKIEENPITSGSEIENGNKFVIESEPMEGYQIRSWKFTLNPVREIHPSTAPLFDLDASSDDQAAHEAFMDRKPKYVKIDLLNETVLTYVNMDDPLFKAVVYNEYLTAQKLGIITFIAEAPNDCPNTIRTMQALGWGEGFAQQFNEGNATIEGREWQTNGLIIQLKPISEKDRENFPSAQSVMTIVANPQFNGYIPDAMSVDIKAVFEKIPSANVFFTAEQDNLAALSIKTGDDPTALNTIVPNGGEVMYGKYIALEVGIKDTEKVSLDSITVNGQKLSNVSSTGFASFILTDKYVKDGNLKAVAHLSVAESAPRIVNPTTVYAEAKQICINAANGTPYIVYNTNGQLLAQGKIITQSTKLPMSNGTYIVKLGNKTFKILIK